MARQSPPESLKRALAVLDGKLTVREISEIIHCTKNSVYIQLTRMHKAGQIHIAAWKHVGDTVARCYGPGPGKDAPRLETTTSAQRMRKMRKKLDPYERDLERNRLNALRRKPKPDPLMQAFFGQN